MKFLNIKKRKLKKILKATQGVPDNPNFKEFFKNKKGYLHLKDRGGKKKLPWWPKR